MLQDLRKAADFFTREELPRLDVRLCEAIERAKAEIAERRRAD